MMTITTAIIVASIIPWVVIMLNMMLTKINHKSRKKMTPFECGFNPMSSPRTPFSIQFFLVTLMFLIFDIEIILIVPVLPLMKYQFSISVKLTFMILMLILILSLWVEWSYSFLEWVN